jgi:hypothetical protein
MVLFLVRLGCISKEQDQCSNESLLFKYEGGRFSRFYPPYYLI